MMTLQPLLGLAEEQPFTWWGLAGYGSVPHYLVMGPIVTLVIIIVSLLTRAALSAGDPVVPRDAAQLGFAGKLLDGTRLVIELIVEQGIALVDSLMPHHHEGRKYLWIVVPIFVYILVSNLFGLIPGFLPPSNNLNTNFAVAICVFVGYNVAGVLATGPGYLKHFWAPAGTPLWAAPIVGVLLLVIEVVGHLFRPVTLSLRLFANMTGDHSAFDIFLGMVPIGVPIAFMLMGLLVALVQAYVFALLTAIYIALAVSHDH